MTAEQQPVIPAWRRALPWAAAVIALVIIVPMATFGRNMLLKPEDPGTAGAGKPVFTAGVPYVTLEAFTLPAGDGPTEADHHLSSDGVEVSSVEVVAPSPDGTSVWVVDHPQRVKAGARVRRFSSDGNLEIEFVSRIASTIFTPGHDRDLWSIQSVGSRERLVHYDATGKVARDYEIPEGLVVRSIALDPDGEVWVQYEEWLVDPDTNKSTYSSSLTPIVNADGSPVENVTPEMSADGAFLGADGRLYWPSTELSRPTAGNVYPDFYIVARDSAGEDVGEYDIRDGGRPFAADSAGRVYAETGLVDLAEAPGASTLGDWAYNQVSVGVHTVKGEYARLEIVRDPNMGQWAPAAWPTADGALYSWRWTEEGLAVLVSRPATDTRVLKTTGEYRKPEMRVLVSEAAPTSGDPYQAIDAVERDMWQAVYAGLVSFDASLNATPDLAESIPTPGAGISADGRIIEWKLASGRKWHDGKPVTAQDVVATWNHLRHRHLRPGSHAFPGFERIEKVEADENIVRVTLDRPFGAAPEAFFPYVLPAHIIEPAANQSNGGLFARPVGAGPYRVGRWEPGRLQLERVSTVGSGPGVFEIVFDQSGAQQRYMGADVPTVWSWVPAADRQIITRDAVGTVADVPTGRWFGVFARTTDPVIKDHAVRLALLKCYPGPLVRDLYGLSATATVAPFGTPEPIDTYGVGMKAAKGLSAELDRKGYTKLDAGKRLLAPRKKLRFEYSQTMRGPEQHEVLAEIEEEYKRVVDSTKSILDWANGQHAFYAPVTQGGRLSRGFFQMGAAVVPGFVDVGWGSVFNPADTPSWDNPDGMSITFTRDAELQRLHQQAEATYDAAEREKIGRRIVERVRELKIAYFDQPEVRTIASIGVSGQEPAPFPAGLFHDIENWKVETPQ